MAETEDSKFAMIICPVHGAQGVSRRNFHAQMQRPEAHWECPVCGAACTFDDAYFAGHHKED